MKRRNIKFLLALFISMLSTKASAHDIEVANADGKIIYYMYINNKTELAVSYRGYSYYTYSNEYSGNVVIPRSVTHNGKTYSVTSIGDYAFRDCSGLTSITIPNSVTSIESSAFSGCSGLTSITIPSSVTSIESSAFSGCSGLTSITIPNSVTSIGFEAFFGCSGLTSIIVEGGNSNYDSRDNCNAIIEKTSNQLIVGCNTTTIPNSVTSIGSGAFKNCSGLTSITIPNSVTSIGDYAFEYCSGLTSITIPNSVTIIGGGAFQDCSGLTSVTISKSVTSIGNYAFCRCSGLTSITIPNSVTSIGGGAFFCCSGLTSITIPNSVTSIESHVFGGCSGLTSVTIGNSVTSIGYEAFRGCSHLTSITIPRSVISIGDEAFSNCSGLTSIIVEGGNSNYDSRDNCNAIIEKTSNKLIAGCNTTTIPNSVTSIENSAFSGCRGLTSITIPNSVTSIGDYAFEYCSGLTSVTIPSSVTTIGEYVFGSCSGLTSVTIPNSVTSIGGGVFQDCSGLTSITIPNSVTSIGYRAFENCSGLTSITIPNSVTSIGKSAFSRCSGLISIVVEDGNKEYDSRENCNAIIETTSNTLIAGCKNTVIPNSVTSIGVGAFDGCCSGLTSFTIPNSVTRIWEYAFYNCSSLTAVYCLATDPPGINLNDAFGNFRENATLYVLEEAVGKYEKSYSWNVFMKIVGIKLLDMTVNVSNAFGKVTYGTTVISSEGQQTFEVIENKDVVLSLQPNYGYEVSKVTVNGEDKTEDVVDGRLTLSNVNENVTVNISFGLAGDDATVTIGSEGYVTFCPVDDVDFTSVAGLKAYIGSGFNRKTGNLTMTRVYDVPAGEGLLLKGAPKTYHIPYRKSYSVYVNMLKGVTTDTKLATTAGGYVNYVLGSIGDEVGFCPVPAEGMTLAAGRAYLTIPGETAASRSALNLCFDDEEEATGINASLTDSEERKVNSAVYDLQGRRVEQPRSGLYIRGGKKVIIK